MTRGERALVHGRFRVERELARGGMGVVYAAFDEVTGRRLALKRSLVRPEADSAHLALLFEREYHALSALKHPCIVEVYEYGVDADGAYYTMELLEGQDLRELAPVDPITACRYLRDVASSLALLHARRLLHRDVAPRNVRSTPDGRCKLLDFGALASFGVPGDIVGTPMVMAPEALHGLELDQRADLFSLGALAYWTLTGRHAYPVRQLSELPTAWQVKPAPPSSFATDVPPALDQLVLSLLSPDPMARPVSAGEVIDRLSAIAQLEPESDPSTVLSYLAFATMVERENELGHIREWIHRFMSGRGGALFIESAPGLGKTRLLGEVALLAQLAGAVVLCVNANARRGPLATARALVLQLVQRVPTVAAAALAGRHHLVGAVCEEARSLAGATEPDPARGTNEPSQLEIQAALNGFFLDASRLSPVLFAVDAIDRADVESVTLLAGLARASKNVPLLLATTATTRTRDRLSPAVTAVMNSSAIYRLSPLSENGTETLVRSAFGAVPHLLRTARRLHDASDGNPRHCLDLIEQLFLTGVVQYAEGAWVLPIDLPDAALPSRGGELVVERLGRCSAAAQRLAEAMSVANTSVSLPVCVQLAAHGAKVAHPGRMAPSIFSELEELTESGILVREPDGYRFRLDAFRGAILERVPELQRTRLDKSMGDILLTLGSQDVDVRMQAALHLIRGGEESRGADLIADLAASVLSAPEDPRTILAKNVVPLEIALAVYHRELRPNVELVKLLAPLIAASYFSDRKLALQHGEETVRRLARAVGLDLEGRHRIFPGAKLRLMLALGVAGVKNKIGRKSAREPDFSTLLDWLFRTVLTLTTMATLVIDQRGARRVAAVLEPFAVLGRYHPAAVIHECCVAAAMMCEDRMAEVHRRWSDILDRLPRVPLEPAALLQLRTGAVYALGVLESQRDDDAVIARLEQLEALGGFEAEAIANQLRFLYHGFRGEIDLALRARDKVELYALHQGTAWQVEIWSTSTMSAMYGQTRDCAGHKGIVERLERLKDDIPSLALYWERARGTQFLVRGEPVRAVEAYEESLRGQTPRKLMGWAFAQGGLARAYNELGDFENARRVCEETIPLVEEDRDYVAMNLNVYTEHCLAEAGLGNFEAARLKLGRLLGRHRTRRNPMTLGSLHRTGARIALMEGDPAMFDAHLASMDQWFRSTENPALIAQCEELRRMRAATASRSEDVPTSSAEDFSEGRAVVRSVLSGCKSLEERRRAALELVAERAGSSRAYLHVRSPSGLPCLVCQVGAEEVSADTLLRVVERFASYAHDTEIDLRTVTGVLGPETFDLPPKPSDSRVFPLAMGSGYDVRLVATIAVESPRSASAVPAALLECLATELSVSDELGTNSRADAAATTSEKGPAGDATRAFRRL